MPTALVTGTLALTTAAMSESESAMLSQHDPALAPLAHFSTCELSDALVRLGVPNGGHIPDIRMLAPAPSSALGDTTRLCGPAYTVHIVLASNTTAPRLDAHFIDLAPAGCVVVVDAPPGTSSLPLPLSLHVTPLPRHRSDQRRLGRADGRGRTGARRARRSRVRARTRHRRAARTHGLPCFRARYGDGRAGARDACRGGGRPTGAPRRQTW